VDFEHVDVRGCWRRPTCSRRGAIGGHADIVTWAIPWRRCWAMAMGLRLLMIAAI